MRNLLRGSGVGRRFQGKLTYQTSERVGLSPWGPKLRSPVFSRRLLCSGFSLFLNSMLGAFPGDLIVLIWVMDPPKCWKVKGPWLAPPSRGGKVGVGGGCLCPASPSKSGQSRGHGPDLPAPNWAAPTFDVMITVHSIPSKFELEATLHSLLRVFLGAKHFLKGFFKQPYPNSQEEKLQTLWEVIIFPQLRSDILQNCVVCGWSASRLRSEWNLEALTHGSQTWLPIRVDRRLWEVLALELFDLGWIPALPPPHRVTMSRSLELSKPQFVHLQNGDSFTWDLMGLLGELNRIFCGRCVSHCGPASGKCSEINIRWHVH